MSNTRGILTLQFGNYANYIGAHWWNIQESSFTYDQLSESGEINHDVLYRQGENHNKQTTYTPRLLLVDLEGSLKHLPREGELYGNSLKRGGVNDLAVKKVKENLSWEPSDVEVVAEPEIAKNDFQIDLDKPEINKDEKEYNLEENVDSWTDFLYARYHPRTVNIVNQYRHDAEKQTLDNFSRGEELWKSEEFEEVLCDRIRQYVEECDVLQGFQTIFDSFNGFSGLATKCLQHLNDEYGGKASMAIPVYSPKNTLFENADESMSDSIRVTNSVLTVNQLIEHASLFIPLSTRNRVWRQLGTAREFPSLQYQHDNLYETSSILASYLDTMTLRYRLKDASITHTLDEFCRDLNNYGRKLAAAALSLPFPMDCKKDLIECLNTFEGPLFTELTPNCQIGTTSLFQSVCVRGIPLDRVKRPPEEQSQTQMRMLAYRCETISQMFGLHLNQTFKSRFNVMSVKAAMPTRIPYPHKIFADHLNTSGFVNLDENRAKGCNVKMVPCLAVLQSSSNIGDTIGTLHREGERIKIDKLHRFKACGLEKDEYKEALENLLLFKDNYEN